MRSRLAASPRTLAALGAALWLVGAPAHAVLAAGAVSRTCGADPVANTAAVLCAAPSGPCTASSVTLGAAIDVQNGGCAFDLGGRAFTVNKTFQMTGAGFITVTNAGDITITSTGKLKARGDFVLATATPTPHVTPTPTLGLGTNVPTPSPTQTFVATGPPGTIGGGTITLMSSGTITHAGLLDVSGDSAGVITLDAVGDVLVQSGSETTAVGIASGDDAGEADGGTVEITSRGGSISVSGPITASGNQQAAGGEVDLTAAHDIDVEQTIDASGGADDGGTIDIEAGDDLTVGRTLTVDSNVGAGFGGDITLAAGEDLFGGPADGGALTVNGAILRFNGSDSEASSGDGGELDASAAGPLQFLGTGVTIRGNGGNLFDGDGGTVCIDNTDANPNRIGPLEGNVRIDGTVLLHSGGDVGSGGDFEASAGADFVLNASIDTSGTFDGGTVALDAGGAITVNAPVTAVGTLASASAGEVTMLAGQAADAALTVGQSINASGGASSADGDFVTLSGCSLTVANGVKVAGQGGTNFQGVSGASEIDLVARHPMQLGASAQFLANPGGKIVTTHPSTAAPVLGAGVVFNPPRTDDVEDESLPYPACPVCGDSIRQVGEILRQGRRRRRRVLQRRLQRLHVPDDHAHRDRHPDAHSDGRRDAHPDADGEPHRRPDADGVRHAGPHGDGDRRCHRHALGDAGRHGDRHRHRHRHRHALRHRHAHAHAYGECDALGHRHGDAERDSVGHRDPVRAADRAGHRHGRPDRPGDRQPHPRGDGHAGGGRRARARRVSGRGPEGRGDARRRGDEDPAEVRDGGVQVRRDEARARGQHLSCRDRAEVRGQSPRLA